MPHEAFETLRVSADTIESDGKSRFLLALTKAPGGIVKVVRQYFPIDPNVKPSSAVFEYVLEEGRTKLMRAVVDTPSHSLTVRPQDGEDGSSLKVTVGNFVVWTRRDRWGYVDELGIMTPDRPLMWLGRNIESSRRTGSRFRLSEVLAGKTVALVDDGAGRLVMADEYPGNGNYLQLILHDAADGKPIGFYNRAIALQVDADLLLEHVFGDLIRDPLQSNMEHDDKWKRLQRFALACIILDEGTIFARPQKTLAPACNSAPGSSKAMVTLRSDSQV